MDLKVGLHPFPTTHWSLVEEAGGHGATAADAAALRRAALGELILRYQDPLISHLMVRRRIDGDRAADLLQGFVASQVLERGLFARADPAKGKFRTFLLTTLDRYVSNRFRAEAVWARVNGAQAPSAEDEAQAPAASADCEPDRVFAARWARRVIDEALGLMREECERTGRHDVWGVFEGRIRGPILDGAPPEPYVRLVERYGLISPAQASNVLITGKRMFARALRRVVGEYERSEEQIEAEIAELRQILSRGGA